MSEEWLERVSGALNVPVEALVKRETQEAIVFQNKFDWGRNPVPELKEPTEYDALKDTDLKSQELTTTSGDSFTMWRSEKFDPNKKTFIFFPGNGGHMGYSPVDAGEGADLGEPDSYMQTVKEAINQNHNVIAVNYVGYAGSNTDQPTEAKVFAGVEKTMDWALEQGISPKNMRIAGVSLGTTTAAHAANYMAGTDKFKSLPEDEQQVNLLMMNGNLTVPKAMIPLFAIPEDLVPSEKWQVMLNTGQELTELAPKVGDKGHIAFFRGMKDPATPASQTGDHRNASKGMNFLAVEDAQTRHYTEPKKVFEIFDQMDAGNFDQKGMDASVLQAAQQSVNDAAKAPTVPQLPPVPKQEQRIR